jgi:hypothetical protein
MFFSHSEISNVSRAFSDFDILKMTVMVVVTAPQNFRITNMRNWHLCYTIT